MTNFSQLFTNVRARLARCLRLRHLGLGFVWVWAAAVWVVVSQLSDGSGLGIGVSPSWLAAMVTSAACFLVLSLMARVRPVFASGRVIAAGTACAALGTLCACAVEAFGLPTWASVAAGVLVGLGEGVLYLAWADCYVRCGGIRLETAIPACGLGTLLCVVVLELARNVATWLLCAAPPVVASVMLASVRRHDMPEPSTAAFVPASRPEPAFGRVVAVISLVVFASYALIALPDGAPALLVGRDRIAAERAVSVVEALLALGVAGVSLYRPVRLDFQWLYRWATPVLVGGALVLALQDARLAYAGFVLLKTPDIFIVTSAFFLFATMAREGTARGVAEVGIVLAVVRLGTLAGNAAGSFVQAGALDVLPVIVVCVCLFLVAAALLPSRADRCLLPGGSMADGISPACEELSVRHALTPREAAVMELLARGRSRAYVGEALSLSANTVNSYAKHAYAKLGVHSKQELIDMAERHRPAGAD